jgi:hypothetical protein
MPPLQKKKKKKTLGPKKVARQISHKCKRRKYHVENEEIM